MLIVHDASYTETTFDGYVAPSFLATPGAREVGIEVFSLSKGWNMTGWRTAAVVGNAEAVEAYWRLKTNIDSGMFEAVQLAAADGARAGPAARAWSTCTPAVATWCATRWPRSAWRWSLRAARSTCGRPCPRDTIRLRSASWCWRSRASWCRPGAAYGPNGEGFFRISLTLPDERLAEAVDRLRSSMGG